MTTRLDTYIVYGLIKINEKYQKQINDLTDIATFIKNNKNCRVSPDGKMDFVNYIKLELEINYLFEKWHRECARYVYMFDKKCYNWYIHRAEDFARQRDTIFGKIIML